MNPVAGQSWPSRLSFAVYLACLMALAVLAVTATLRGNTGEAALGGLCLAVALAAPKGGLVTAPVAALLGGWTIAALALACALAVWLRALALHLPRRRPADPAALAVCLEEAPSDLVYAARVLAAERPLSTWHLVALASRANPKLWRGTLGDDPGEEAWDGPVLKLGDAGAVSVFLAEAVGLGAEIARRREHRIDPDLLALSACLIPLSAAEEWSRELDSAAERILGASLLDLIECQTAFARTPAGRDLTRRVQVGYWAHRFLLRDRKLIYEVELKTLPRLLWGVFR